MKNLFNKTKNEQEIQTNNIESSTNTAVNDGEEKKNETSPKKPSRLEKILNKIKGFFFILNLISIALFTTYSLYGVYNKTKSTAMSKAIIGLLIIYAIAFICLVVCGIKNKKKLKTELKNYKSAINILKQFVKLLNLSLSIITAVNVFFTGGTPNLFNLIVGWISFSLAVLSIMFEVLKIIIRKKLAKRKERKLALKEQKENSSAF